MPESKEVIKNKKKGKTTLRRLCQKSRGTKRKEIQMAKAGTI